MRRSRMLAAVLVSLAVLTAASPASAMYHPTLGKWATRDPVGQVHGRNLYEAVSANPINRTDPEGLRDMILGNGVVIGSGRTASFSPGPDTGFPNPNTPENVQDMRRGVAEYNDTPDIGVNVNRRPDHTWISYPPNPGYTDLGGEMGYPPGYANSIANKLYGQPSTWSARVDRVRSRKMQDGPAVGKTCDCVKVDDVYACFRAVRADPQWGSSPNKFDYDRHNCRDFVRDVLSRCCLIQPGEMTFDSDLWYEKGPDVGQGDATIEDWNKKMRSSKK